jgi:hypothetical protein
MDWGPVTDPGGGSGGDRIAIGLCCLALLFVSLVVAVGVWPRSNGAIALSQLPPGVTAHVDHDRSIFLVRSARDVRAFLADARYRPEDELWWCPIEHAFIGSPAGGLFDESGRKISGPARSGLVRLGVDVSGGRVSVDLDDRTTSMESDRGTSG